MEAFETEVNRRQNLHLPFSRTITVQLVNQFVCHSLRSQASLIYQISPKIV